MLYKSNFIIVLMVLFIITTSSVLSSFRPPQGSTGATPGVTCSNNGTGCHASFPVNSVGGTITATGLPTVYTPGASYTFSITITHGMADRTRWGFSVAAQNSSGTTIGTFSDNNAFAAPNGTELSHGDPAGPNFAPITTAQASYTFDNLIWTAPSTGMGTVNFYYAGAAGNADGGVGGDYIYAGNTAVFALPVVLTTFDASVKSSNVMLSWKTSQETNSDYFMVQKSSDNSQFNDIGKVHAAGSSSLSNDYSFIDQDFSVFEKPVYYRLAIVDRDGKKAFSKITSIILRATHSFVKRVYPNPIKRGGVVHVNFVSTENEILYLRLIDNQGRLINTMSVMVNKGTNILNVPVPGISAGNYKLVLKTKGTLMQEPVMIQ